MINELMTLAESMERAGITPERWDDSLKQLKKPTKKHPRLRVSINTEGEITSIDQIPDKLVQSLRSYQSGANGWTFPGFDVRPLFLLNFEDEALLEIVNERQFSNWKSGKEPIDIQVLKDLCIDERSNWKQDFKKVNQCLFHAVDALEQAISTTLEDAPTLTEIVGRAKLLRTDFRNKLTASLFGFIEKSDSELAATYLGILFHCKTPSESTEKSLGTVSVFMELDDWHSSSKTRPVAHVETMKLMNRLVANAKKSNEEDEERVDPLGFPAESKTQKMPEVRLGGALSKISLRSFAFSNQCQIRYGLKEQFSYPLGSQSRNRLKSAIEWLSSSENQKITWQDGVKGERIFAFPEKLSKVPAPLAQILGEPTAAGQALNFLEKAKQVISALQGKFDEENRDFAIFVFALRKMDSARTKVVFDGTYTARGLIEAAEAWEVGCNNVPPIRWRQWGAKKGEIVDGSPKTLFPLQFATCLNRVWKQASRVKSTDKGKKTNKLLCETKSESQDIQTSEGVSLLMNDFGRGFLDRCLKVALTNSKNLLVYIGCQITRNQIAEVTKGFDHHKSILPSCLGLILHKLNIKKVNYMKDVPFLLGQILKISDEIHALYCKVVRKDSYPQQLLGNALMVSALESPNQAMATLATRINAYLGWAKSHRFKKQNPTGDPTFTTDKQAGWYISLYERVADQIAVAGLIPDRFDDKDKAQLLLGYLASHPKKEND